MSESVKTPETKAPAKKTQAVTEAKTEAVLYVGPIVVAASIPSAFTGFCFWLIEQNLKKRADNEKEEREERQRQLDEREQIREKNELCIINSVNAAIALGEATARAVQRIPDAHCNGDMHAALDYAQKVKHEQKNFLNEQALKHIIEEGEQTS